MSSLHCEFVVYYHGKNTSLANVFHATICYGQHTPVPSICTKNQPKQSNKQLTAQCNFISPLLSSRSPHPPPLQSLCVALSLCCRLGVFQSSVVDAVVVQGSNVISSTLVQSPLPTYSLTSWASGLTLLPSLVPPPISSLSCLAGIHSQHNQKLHSLDRLSSPLQDTHCKEMQLLCQVPTTVMT